ncbi:MAG: hypothetical protein GXP55_14820 [Deltaproteobacteria bacterium]|nr:hypothetical protein [Deltaproteobacteria bacterium]
MKSRRTAELRDLVLDRARSALITSLGPKAARAATLVDTFHVDRVVLREVLEEGDSRAPREATVVIAPKALRAIVESTELVAGFGPLGTCTPRADLLQASEELRLSVNTQIAEWEEDSGQSLPTPSLVHQQADIAVLKLRGMRVRMVVSLATGEVLGSLDRGRAPVVIMGVIGGVLLKFAYGFDVSSNLGQLVELLVQLSGWGLLFASLFLGAYYQQSAPVQEVGLPRTNDWS